MEDLIINPSVIAEGEPETVKADMRKFNRAKEQVSLAVTELKKYAVITTAATQTAAMGVLSLAKKVDTAIEAKRKQLVKPWNDEKDRINQFAKDLTKDLTDEIEAVKKEVLRFSQAEEQKALDLRTAQRKQSLATIGFVFAEEGQTMAEVEGVGTISIREVLKSTDADFNDILKDFNQRIAAAAQKQLEAIQPDTLTEVFGSEEEKAPLPPAPAPVTAAPVFSSGGNFAVKGTTRRWTFKITDATLVPREFLIVDEVAIRKAILAGTRSIAGIEIFQDTSLTIR